MRVKLAVVCVLLALVGMACESKQEQPSPEAPQAPSPDKAATAQDKKPAPTEVAPEPAKAGAQARGKDQRPMVQVPAGPFVRGSQEGQGKEEESPQKTLTLKEFWIDRAEVTVADWGRCVEAGACTSAMYRVSREKKTKAKKKRPVACNFQQEGREAHPMNCVSWQGAVTYCEWAGKRLPTEAEWEKAARGDKGQSYPWGEEKASCRKACMEERGLFGCGERTTCPSGSRSGDASPYGAVDMAGNVYEWVQDYYSKDFYAQAPEADPINQKRAAQHPVRGGAYSSDAEGVRAAQRSSFKGDDMVSFVGFRCAMDP